MSDGPCIVLSGDDAFFVPGTTDIWTRPADGSSAVKLEGVEIIDLKASIDFGVGARRLVTIPPDEA